MTILVGVDPGVKGAFAFFYDDGRQVVLDVPVREKHGGGNEVDPRMLQQMLRYYVPADEKGLVVMESSHAFMGSGKRVGSMASQASLAATKAVIAAVCELSGMDIAYVTPKAWQAFFGIRKTDSEDTKDQSFRIARQLYPNVKITKTSGRPDALLIGRYAQRNLT